VVLVQGILEKIKLSFKIQFVVIFMFLSLFVVLVGPSPSVVRAALMGVIMLIARLFGRSCSGLRALVLASATMLLYNPFYLFSVSFQLSFLATFGLLSFFDITDVISFKWAEIIKETAWATIVANLYTLPVLINTFGYFSPLSIIPNVIILPVIPVTMLLELLIFVPFVGGYLGIFAGLVCAWILGFVEWLSSWLPLVHLEKLEIWEIGIWYLGLAGIAFWVRHRKQNESIA
jgi:competence protein ComEC